MWYYLTVKRRHIHQIIKRCCRSFLSVHCWWWWCICYMLFLVQSRVDSNRPYGQRALYKSRLRWRITEHMMSCWCRHRWLGTTFILRNTISPSRQHSHISCPITAVMDAWVLVLRAWNLEILVTRPTERRTHTHRQQSQVGHHRKCGVSRYTSMAHALGHVHV